MHRVTLPSGNIVEFNSKAMEENKEKFEDQDCQIDNPILPNNEALEALKKGKEFIPCGAPQTGLKTLSEFIESGDVEAVKKHQKDLGELYAFLKSCQKCLNNIESIMETVLNDCSEYVNDTFSFLPGYKSEKCKDFDVFIRMCNENNISIEDACKALFSSITIKNASKLFGLSAKNLRERYNFEVQQYKNRIKLI